MNTDLRILLLILFLFKNSFRPGPGKNRWILFKHVIDIKSADNKGMGSKAFWTKARFYPLGLSLENADCKSITIGSYRNGR